ncbi:hypothetical protein [Mycobacterium sp. E3247]|uniref:hypothetical protein n=1 Tax=Mycobacterium sp. E3247 TaxID=1856864 RepID=UPI00080095A3|nr:hypothetical protein [Mycobacterium sp. E3247]OBG99978.1 hypothetical protein A9X04_29155 [Mycobacterium sp. E3247]
MRCVAQALGGRLDLDPARLRCTGPRVDDALRQKAAQRSGAAGVLGITVLTTGTFHAGCAILTALAIPAPDQS